MRTQLPTLLSAVALCCACESMEKKQEPLTWDTAKTTATEDVRSLPTNPTDAENDTVCIDRTLALAETDMEGAKKYLLGCVAREKFVDMEQLVRAATKLGGTASPEVLEALVTVLGRRGGDVPGDTKFCRKAGLDVHTIDGESMRAGTVLIAHVRLLEKPERGKRVTIAEVAWGGGIARVYARRRNAGANFVIPTGHTIDATFTGWRTLGAGDYVIAMRVERERAAKAKDWELVNEATGDSPLEASGDLVSPPVPVGTVVAVDKAAERPHM